MRIRQLAALVLLLSLPAGGCGSSADDADSSAASRESPRSSVAPDANDSPHGGATGNATATNPPAAESPGDSATSSRLKEAPPTEEQLARWTPPPFEPLQLLAIRQWKKTSFSSRIAAAPDGSRFLVAGSRVLLWSLTADEPEHVFLDLTADDSGRELLSLAVSPDGEWFAVGDSEGTVRIWSLADRKELVSKSLYPTGVRQIAISPDAREIATISYDAEATVWTADTLEKKRSFRIASRGVERIEYAAPNLLAAAGESTALWNAGDGEKAHDLPAGRYNFALARSDDGKKLLFGAEEGLRIWDVAAAKPEATEIRGVGGDALLSLSHDGKLLATSDGRSVELWSLADGRRLQSIQGFGWTIVGLAWMPRTNLLAVASDVGVTRVWGTPAQGEPFGLKPLHSPVATPDPAAKEPASPEQVEQLIDWRTFPSLPGSESNVRSAADLFGVAPVDVAEARAFYRRFLTQAGWTESAQDPHNPAAMEFHKGDAKVAGYFSDGGDGKTDFTLRLEENYDVRWAPKADAAAIEVVYENAGTSSYRAKATLLQIETSLLDRFHAAGWAAYARLNSSSSEEPDKRDIEFLKNGVTLRVSIGKFPDDTADTYTVQQSLFSNSAWAPVPPGAGFIEFDGSTEPEMIALTSMGLPEARQFYDRELNARGWLSRTIGRSIQAKRNWLPYLRGQCNLSVSLTKLPDGRTLVRIGEASGSMWDAAQSKEDQGEEPPSSGLQAAEFPLLSAAGTGEFDSLGKTIVVRLDGSTLGDAATRYAKALGDLGWKAEEGGIRDEEYTFFNFTKGDQEISFRARRQDGAAVVSFEGDGLLWTKELPGGKKLVSYETWLRLNKLPPSLEFLQRYEAEMKAIEGS